MSSHWRVFRRRPRPGPGPGLPHPVQRQSRTYTVTLASSPASILLASRTARTVFTAWGLSPQVGTMDALLLIATELVSNSVRHAGCGHTTVTFTEDGTVLGVAVHDCGPDLPAQAPTGPGGGLAAVREVAEAFGGSIDISHGPGKPGKTVRAVLPRPSP